MSSVIRHLEALLKNKRMLQKSQIDDVKQLVGNMERMEEQMKETVSEMEELEKAIEKLTAQE